MSPSKKKNNKERIIPVGDKPTPGFCSNRIRTARYSVLTFLPLQLWHQFTKFANIYFLFISSLQAVPGWSSTGRFTTIIPLSFFVSLSIIREAFDDWQRHKHDRKENSTRGQRLSSAASPAASSSHFTAKKTHPAGPLHWETCQWKDIRVGDVLLIKENDFIPADVLVLSSSLPDGICYIETSNLDGETNLKMKQALNLTHNVIQNNPANISALHATVYTEQANGDLYNFEGAISINNSPNWPPQKRNSTRSNASSASSSSTFPLFIDQLLLRGSTLKNTKSVIGLVIYTGEDTRIRKNSTKKIHTKSPAMEKIINRITLYMFVVVVVLSLSFMGASKIWQANVNKDNLHWYLGTTFNKDYESFFTFVILYNTLIPLSLYVTMEMVKLVQVWLMKWDLAMYDKERDIPFEASTCSLNEDLGQVQYVFSDKTGTLTENIMEFKNLSVSGISYSLGPCAPPTSSVALPPKSAILFEEESTMLSSSSMSNYATLTDRIQPRHSTLPIKELLSQLEVAMKQQQQGIDTLSANLLKGFQMLEGIALCHAVIPQNDDGTVQYQSSSPDEVALLNAAREMKFVLSRRDQSHIYLEIFGVERAYKILNVVPFTSGRKRMSVVVETEGQVVLYMKGADHVILERLSPEYSSDIERIEYVKSVTDHLERYATQGLRTLLYSRRVIDQDEYDEWNDKYSLSCSALSNRTELMEETGEIIEWNMELLGATAIEDKLQKDVPETIEKLGRAGIKVWMLTGDKRETAMNIGLTCRLYNDRSHVFHINDGTLEEIEQCLNETWSQIRSIKRTSSSLKDISLKKMPHLVVVIEGKVLTKLEDEYIRLHCPNTPHKKVEYSMKFDSLLRKFICIGVACQSALCCRFSPHQKAVIVRKVKEFVSLMHEGRYSLSDMWKYSRKDRPSLFERIKAKFLYPVDYSGVTLAIGDGANDIPMLQSAHVGIGITGREGLAASRASDYSISQFRFLQQLLFVHGRYNYIRVSRFILGTFYKGIAFFCSQGAYQLWTGFTGTSIYEQWTLAMYNILFSSLPVLFLGMFEKDLNKSTLLAVPEHYQYGQRNKGFNMFVYWKWIIQALWHMAVAVIIPFTAFSGLKNFLSFGRADSNGHSSSSYSLDISGIHSESSIYVLGNIVYTSIIFFTSIKVCFVDSSRYNAFTIGSWLFSVIIWFLFQFVYSTYTYPYIDLGVDSKGMWDTLMRIQPLYWTIVVLTVCIGMLFTDYLGLAVKWLWRSGIRHTGMNTYVDPRIGDMSRYDTKTPEKLFEAQVKCASDVVEYLHSTEIPISHWNDAVEWWQMWERHHGVSSDQYQPIG